MNNINDIKIKMLLDESVLLKELKQILTTIAGLLKEAKTITIYKAVELTGSNSNRYDKKEQAEPAISPPDTAPNTLNEEWMISFRDLLSRGLDIASQISDILGVGAHTFAAQLISALDKGVTLAGSIASFISSINNLGAFPGGGILSFISSFFGFAEGGRVPGSGAGDTVPAMLTPGEFVIRKSIVDKMGSSFFAWINGGLLPSMAGHYSMGGIVSPVPSPVVNNSFDVHIDRRGDVHVVQKALRKLKSNRTYFGG